jgi:hypothetical protein
MIELNVPPCSRILYVYVPSVVGKEDVKKVPLYGTYARVRVPHSLRYMIEISNINF